MKTASMALRGCLLAAAFTIIAAAQDIAPGAPAYRKGDRLRPRPTVIDPGDPGTQERPGRPPSDAVILFDGRDLSKWMEYNPRGKDDPSKGPKWNIRDGYCEAAGNHIQTRDKFADCHVHIEWMTDPDEARIPGRVDQRRGNSGIEIGKHPEIQILNSYQNDTYPDGQAAAIYGVLPPLVNASRPPGEWQTYDIFYTAPRFENGKKTRKATYTVLHNGIPVHLSVELKGDMEQCSIHIRPHGCPVRFRNMWVRPLHRYDENHGKPLPPGAYTTKP